MALSPDQPWLSIQQLDKALQAKLAEKEPTYEAINNLIAELRQASEAFIFLDFALAKRKNVELKLWDAHSKINARYRKMLARFREENGRKKPVQLRKMEKHYLQFIKTSQRFYRGFILRLSREFGGIPELEEVAHRLKPGETVPHGSAKVTADLRHDVLVSCHQALVRSGDLSRYRETELSSAKDRHWGPAIGFYELAGAIYPTSGASHNQLAVIALADGNHLRATYHLYRALTVEEPHPTAKANLELELKKINTAWSKGGLIVDKPTSSDGGDAGKTLVAWFIRLHARCYRGRDFPEHEELESEVMTQLAVGLRERAFDAILNKFILINVSAQDAAGVRFAADPQSTEAFQAYFFFVRLNVKTLITLLRLLQADLEKAREGEGQVDNFEETVTEVKRDGRGERILAVTRRVLPGLRHYSSWLLSNTAILVAEEVQKASKVQMQDMWRAYARCLTLLATLFQVQTLPVVEYLLEEDEDTLGFRPFQSLDNASMRRRYYGSDSTIRKPRMHDAGIERQHPNAEMLFRVRDFLVDGVELALADNTPITIANGGRFTFSDDDIPLELLSTSNPPSQAEPGPEPEPELEPTLEVGPTNAIAIPLTGRQPPTTALSESPSMSRSMINMVSALVDNAVSDHDISWSPTLPPTTDFAVEAQHATTAPRRSDQGAVSRPANTLTASELLNTLPWSGSSVLTPYEMLSASKPPASAPPNKTHSPRPSIPWIGDSPFAPQREERSGEGSPQGMMLATTGMQSSSGLPPPSSCLLPVTPGLKTHHGSATSKPSRYPMGGSPAEGNESHVYGEISAFDDPSALLNSVPGVQPRNTSRQPSAVRWWS